MATNHPDDANSPPRRRLSRRVVALALVVATCLALAGAIAASVLVGSDERAGSPPSISPTVTTSPPPTTGATTAPTEPSGPVRYVSPSGSDDAAGTEDQPWRTLQHALSTIEAGDTLYVMGGTYEEDVQVTPHEGTPDQPVQVFAYPGERPVVEGLLWLNDASYWHLDGINVTWSSRNGSDHHMVKLHGGTGWRFSNAELWGARSFAALLIGDGAEEFLVDHNFIHDTYPSNDNNQDHLIYVDNGHDGSGTIEHNVLARSANGRGVKLGPGDLDDSGTDNIVVRFNTFFDNRGPSNIQLSGSSSDNEIYGNLLYRSASGTANITAYELSGHDNVVRDNLGWRSDRVVEWDGDGFVDGGRNIHADPQLADPDEDDFRARWSNARSYGAADTAEAVAAASAAG
jgi:hypothetical protein